jgi:hypothetical protein
VRDVREMVFQGGWKPIRNRKKNGSTFSENGQTDDAENVATSNGYK